MHLDPERHLVSDVFVRGEAAATIRSGDRFTVRTLDAGGYFGPWTVLDDPPPRLIADARGHCLAGPIVVAYAEPGQFLAITVHDLRPDAHGYTVAGTHENWLNAQLGVTDPALLAWTIDGARATNQHGHVVPVAPFLGVIGVVPDADGEHSTIPPRTRAGGNIDCRELVAGSTLYLPVVVPGAYLFVGDGHAAQGDGEVSGTAIECGMSADLTVRVTSEVALDAVHAEVPGGRITFGFDADLNAATAEALAHMVTWLQHLHAVDRPTALALASVAVDLHVTQIANETWGVHALLSHDRLNA